MLSDEQLHDLATDYFADQWAIDKAILLMQEVEAEARREALEEAAQKCESQWSNAAEKLYGIECAAAIRKLKEDIQEPPRPHAPRQASAHP